MRFSYFDLAMLLLLMATGIICLFQKLQIDSLEATFNHQEELIHTLQQKVKAASAAQLAISEQAQACLDRESRMNADNGIWLEILEQSQSRDLTDKEKGHVPDDKTRNALLDALDRPL